MSNRDWEFQHYKLGYESYKTLYNNLTPQEARRLQKENEGLKKLLSKKEVASLDYDVTNSPNLD